MAEIHQALKTAHLSVGDRPTEGVRANRFLSMSGIVEEPEGSIVNVNLSHVSFGLPLERVEALKDLRLGGGGTKYLNISGVDLLGQKKSYSIEVDEDAREKMAWQLYTTLGAVKGQPFIKDHLFDWTNWMS